MAEATSSQHTELVVESPVITIQCSQSKDDEKPIVAQESIVLESQESQERQESPAPTQAAAAEKHSQAT